MPVAPEVVYLDSAHEKGETLLELHTAFRALSPGGVLFGDDTAWPAVRHDVFAFVSCLRPPSNHATSIELAVASQLRADGVKLIDSCSWFATPEQLERNHMHHGVHAIHKGEWICPSAANSSVPSRRVLFFRNAWMIVKDVARDDSLSKSDKPWCKFLQKFSLLRTT